MSKKGKDLKIERLCQYYGGSKYSLYDPAIKWIIEGTFKIHKAYYYYGFCNEGPIIFVLPYDKDGNWMNEEKIGFLDINRLIELSKKYHFQLIESR